MRELILILLFALPCWGVAYNTQQTGPWNTASTWTTGACGTNTAPAVPVSGDTVNICNGHTVTMAANNTIGAGGASGTYAVTVAQGGTLITNAGTKLTAKGGISGQLGAVITLNGSVDVDTPAATVYSISRVAGGAGQMIVTLGPSSGTRETYQTITTVGTATNFRIDGATVGGFSIVIRNAIINQCGGGANKCMTISTLSGTNPTCTITNVLVNNSGEFGCDGTGTGTVTQTASHVDIRNTTSTTGFAMRMANTTAIVSGQRSWDNITAYGTGTQAMSCAMNGCQWGNSATTTQGGLAAGTVGGYLYDSLPSTGNNAKFQNVFVLADTASNLTHAPQARANLADSNNIRLAHMSNPHFIGESSDAAISANSYTNDIFDGDGYTGGSNEGDILIGGSSGTASATLSNSLGINEAGTLCTLNNSVQAFTVTHDTVFNSYPCNVGETGGGAGQLAAFKSNLISTPGTLQATPTNWFQSGLSADTAFVSQTTLVNIVDFNAFWAMPGSGDTGAAANCPTSSQQYCTLPNGNKSTTTSYMAFPQKNRIASATVTGTTSATDLTCGACNFTTSSVVAGDYIWDSTQGKTARIATVNSATNLTLVSPGIVGLTNADSFAARASYSTNNEVYGTTAGFGTNDIHANPYFHDSTVTICKWYLLVNGSGNACPDATTGNLVALAKQLVLLNGYDFQGNPGSYNSGFNISSAQGYIRSGFMPMNTALRAAGHDSADIGALSVGSIRHKTQ